MLYNQRRLQAMLKRRQEMLAQTRVQLNKEHPEVEERVDTLVSSFSCRVLFPDYQRKLSGN